MPKPDWEDGWLLDRSGGVWDAGEMNWLRLPLLSSPVGEGCVHQ